MCTEKHVLVKKNVYICLPLQDCDEKTAPGVEINSLVKKVSERNSQ